MVLSPVATSSSAGENWGNKNRRSVISRGHPPLLLLIHFCLHRFPVPYLLNFEQPFELLACPAHACIYSDR